MRAIRVDEMLTTLGTTRSTTSATPDILAEASAGVPAGASGNILASPLAADASIPRPGWFWPIDVMRRQPARAVTRATQTATKLICFERIPTGSLTPRATSLHTLVRSDRSSLGLCPGGEVVATVTCRKPGVKRVVCIGRACFRTWRNLATRCKGGGQNRR